jgi:hypothetical protein
MAGTTMAAVKSALKTMVTTAVGSGVLITYGDPGETARTEMVYIGAAVDNAHDPVALRSGPRKRDEDYTVSIMVEVSSKGTPEATEARAVALGTLIETAIAADPKLNNTANVLWAVVSGMSLDTSEAATAPRTRLTIDVSVKARLV